MKRTLGFALVAVAVIAACTSDGDGLGPQVGPLRLEASINRSVLRWGEVESLVFRVVNVGPDSLTLSFTSTCQTLPYITTSTGGAVLPYESDWGCGDAITRLTLAPGGEDTTAIRIYPCSAREGMMLPGGEYRAYARFVHPFYEMRSRTIEFRVRCT